MNAGTVYIATSAPSGTNLASFANDAAFVAAKGSSASDGDQYNRTTSPIGPRYYAEAAWRTDVSLDQTQTLTNKTLTSPLINGLRFSIATKTSTYQVLVTDDLVIMDVSGGAFTSTLPTGAGAGKLIRLKKSDATFTIATISRGGSSDTIGASASTTTTLNTQGESVDLVYDGVSNWVVSNRHIPSVITAYTPTFTGFGTVTGVDIYWKRIGDSAYIYGRVTAGTVSSSAWSMTLPSGTAKGVTGVAIVGDWGRNNGGGTAVKRGVLTLSSGASVLNMGSDDYTGTNSPTASLNGNSIFGSSQDMVLRCTVPITGWNG